MSTMDRLIGQQQFDCEHQWRTLHIKGKPFIQRCRKCEAQLPCSFVGRRETTALDAVSFLGDGEE